MSPSFQHPAPRRDSPLLVDLHTHTTRYSDCSRLAPEALVDLARARGLSGLVLTEHHACWPEHELAELAARAPELTLYPGVEVSTAEGYDVVAITDARVQTFPGMYTAELVAALGKARAASFLFLAHPFRYQNEELPGFSRLVSQVDGIEMRSVNIMKFHAVPGSGFQTGEPPYYLPDNHARYEAARERHSLIPVYTTDTHRPCSVGALATALDRETLPGAALPGSSAELAALLKRNRHHEYQSPERLADCLGEFESDGRPSRVRLGT